MLNLVPELVLLSLFKINKEVKNIGNHLVQRSVITFFELKMLSLKCFGGNWSKGCI